MQKKHRLNWLFILNNCGEVDPPPPKPTGPPPPSFSQEQVNAIVGERLAREREKYPDYEDLQKFKTDHETKTNQQAQKDLEEQRKYDEAKVEYEKQLVDHKAIISQKDQAIRDMTINNVLTTEIINQNGFVEESSALLKSMTVVNDDGTIRIKGKDSNGMDTQLSIEEGVKQFLTNKPHLVKVNQQGGGGTPPAGAGGGGAGGEGTDLMSLNQQYQQAKMSGNAERAKELKTKIESSLATKNVSRSI